MEEWDPAINDFVPPIRGTHLDGVVLLRNYEDGEKIKALITNGADSAIIVGAVFSGIVKFVVALGPMRTVRVSE